MTQLQILRNGRKRLIRLNEINHYTQSGNPKIEKYYRLLLDVKKEISKIECVNVRPTKARVGLTAKDLRQLTENLN